MSYYKQLLLPADDYTKTSWLFLKLLALIYFSAFFSMAVQVSGLVGPTGILPFQNVLDNFYQQQGGSAWWKMPTLFWFGAGNLALHTATVLGCVFSALLFLGRWQRFSLIALFILYLSLYHAGQTFLKCPVGYSFIRDRFSGYFFSRRSKSFTHTSVSFSIISLTIYVGHIQTLQHLIITLKPSHCHILAHGISTNYLTGYYAQEQALLFSQN